MVVSGGNKGETGRVLEVVGNNGKRSGRGFRVIVEGVNLKKRHQSARRFPEAGIISRPAPIDASNVMLLDPKDGKPTRVRIIVDNGKKQRISVRSGSVLGG